MKRLLFVVSFAIALSGCDVLQQLPTTVGAGAVSEAEAGQGIKEALSQGLSGAVLQLNKEDGFFKDAFYKILLPPDAKKIENTLRDLGMGKVVDKAILQINRGAEDAAGYAKPIFADAIRNMTLQDAIGLVKNGDTSATHFFRQKTTSQLMATFLPVIKSSLDKVQATKYYGDIVNTYNNFPTTFIDPAFNDDRLKNIIQYYSINPDEMEKELHIYAKELLDAGKVNEAWQVLLSSG